MAVAKSRAGTGVWRLEANVSGTGRYCMLSLFISGAVTAGSFANELSIGILTLGMSFDGAAYMVGDVCAYMYCTCECFFVCVCMHVS